jgi:hypothetical protein
MWGELGNPLALGYVTNDQEGLRLPIRRAAGPTRDRIQVPKPIAWR